LNLNKKGGKQMLRTDLHIHTIVSGHAYSTILESVTYAKDIGIETIAITDHGPSMKGASHSGYFKNMDRIPGVMHGVNLLMGCEANVIGLDGEIDLDCDTVDKLDIVLVGLHKLTPYPSNTSSSDNTRALISAIKKNKVHIVSHPYRLDFPVDIIELAKAASGYGVLLELNLSLLRIFGNNLDLFNQISLMIETVEKMGSKIVISSDAHFVTEIGDDSVLSSLGINILDKLVLGGHEGYNEVKSFLISRG
jgi:putative hydrolase